MSLVDAYIRRATNGLPNRKRLDTAAELRVHLNQRIEELMGEGFAREEAEHLAVTSMGPVAPVNRSLLGHVFTAPLGWLVVALLMVATGAYVAQNYMFAPAEVARPLDLDGGLASMLFPGDLMAVELTLPRGARTLSYVITKDSREEFSAKSHISVDESLRPNERTKWPLMMGLLPFSTRDEACPTGTAELVVVSGSGRVNGCVEGDGNANSWQERTRGGVSLKLDTWIPLLVLDPSAGSSSVNTDGGTTTVVSRSTDPASWLVLSVYLSRLEIAEMGELPPPPGASSLPDHWGPPVR